MVNVHSWRWKSPAEYLQLYIYNLKTLLRGFSFFLNFYQLLASRYQTVALKSPYIRYVFNTKATGAEPAAGLALHRETWKTLRRQSEDQISDILADSKIHLFCDPTIVVARGMHRSVSHSKTAFQS